jgi:nitrogen fixation NifU-like protein
MPAPRGYDDLIMDHIKNARGYRVLDDASHHASGANPLCGDEMTVYVKLDGERIESVTYQCACCGISMASASMMSQLLEGQDRAQVKTWLQPFIAAIIAHAEPPDVSTDPMHHALLKTVRDLPVRTPCAALPWATLAAALEGRTETVTVRV